MVTVVAQCVVDGGAVRLSEELCADKRLLLGLKGILMDLAGVKGSGNLGTFEGKILFSLK